MFAAQYWGKGDRRSVEKVFAYVLKVTTIVSALFGAAGLTIPDLLMKIFTNEPVLIERGAQYLRVVAVLSVVRYFTDLSVRVKEQ